MKLKPVDPKRPIKLDDDHARAHGDVKSGKSLERATEKHVKRISDLQRVLYADARHALLIVLQGRDASGKDGTIRKVFTAVNPQGCSVASFKAPERTGQFGATERHDLLTASARPGGEGCITNVDVQAPDAGKGQQVTVRLVPSRLKGHWCAGVYRGKIQAIESARCPRHLPCPRFAVQRGVGMFVADELHASPLISIDAWPVAATFDGVVVI